MSTHLEPRNHHGVINRILVLFNESAHSLSRDHLVNFFCPLQKVEVLRQIFNSDSIIEYFFAMASATCYNLIKLIGGNLKFGANKFADFDLASLHYY